MDTTEKYIKMCEKAIEIQSRINTFTAGDFIWKGQKYLYDAVFVCDKAIFMKEEEIWLPRQDQLQDMLNDSVDDLVSKFIDRMTYRLMYINKLEITYPKLESMEQVWLTFIMKEKYHKIWKDEDWVEV